MKCACHISYAPEAQYDALINSSGRFWIVDCLSFRARREPSMSTGMPGSGADGVGRATGMWPGQQY
jgi:hypothetical protein